MNHGRARKNNWSGSQDRSPCRPAGHALPRLQPAIGRAQKHRRQFPLSHRGTEQAVRVAEKVFKVKITTLYDHSISIQCYSFLRHQHIRPHPLSCTKFKCRITVGTFIT